MTTPSPGLLDTLINHSISAQEMVQLRLVEHMCISGVPESIDADWIAMRLSEPLAEGREYVRLVRRDLIEGAVTSLDILTDEGA